MLGILRSLPAAAAPAPPAIRLLDAPESEDRDLMVSRSDTPETTGDHDRYRVVPGDSLWAIACRDLGAGTNEEIDRRWREIYAANRELIGANPDLIFPGQMLIIPEPTGA